MVGETGVGCHTRHISAPEPLIIHCWTKMCKIRVKSHSSKKYYQRRSACGEKTSTLFVRKVSQQMFCKNVLIYKDMQFLACNHVIKISDVIMRRHIGWPSMVWTEQEPHQQEWGAPGDGRSEPQYLSECLQKISNIIAEASEQPKEPTAEDIALRAAKLVLNHPQPMC